MWKIVCLGKFSRETHQNLSYFWNKKTQIFLFCLLFVLSNFGFHLLLKIQTNEKKTICVSLFKKYGTFWSVSLNNFIKHKPLIIKSDKSCLFTIFFADLPDFQEKLAPTTTLVTTIPTKETLMDVTPKKVVEPPHTASNGNIVVFSLNYIFFMWKHIILGRCKKIKFIFLLFLLFFSAIFKWWLWLLLWWFSGFKISSDTKTRNIPTITKVCLHFFLRKIR